MDYNLAKLEQRLILKALNKSDDILKSCILLGISQPTLYRKIKQYKIVKFNGEYISELNYETY